MDFWNINLGTWILNFEIWPLNPGTWTLEFEPWNLEFNKLLPAPPFAAFRGTHIAGCAAVVQSRPRGWLPVCP